MQLVRQANNKDSARLVVSSSPRILRNNRQSKSNAGLSNSSEALRRLLPRDEQRSVAMAARVVGHVRGSISNPLAAILRNEFGS